MHVVQLNYGYDADLPDPAALLARYETLTAWSGALLAGGASRATIAQRFSCDADFRHEDIQCLFRDDRGSPFPRPWSWPRRLHEAVVHAQPDVIHVNGLIFPAQIRLLRQALPPTVPVVIQDHANAPPSLRWPRWASRVRRLAWRSGLAGADAFLFAAADQARPWVDAGLIAPPQTVHALPLASRCLTRLPRDEARRLTGVRGAPALLFVGRLNENKDPFTILAGFAQALPFLPDARLTLVFQTDELLAEVRARLSTSPALAARVDLRGRVPPPQMASFYSAADLFVLGSHHEGCSLALLEALASGLVPVVTDIPSSRASVGNVGGLFPPGDANALAASLADLGRRDLAPLRAAVLAHYERELSWPAVGRRALAIYREVRERRG